MKNKLVGWDDGNSIFMMKRERNIVSMTTRDYMRK